jgi:uncharacterized protein YjiS (DUF1127 family)
MTMRFVAAMGAGGVDCRQREGKAETLSRTVASLWTEFCCAWMRWLARNRLQRSIALLDDRLLADIGLCPRDLGFAQRFLRGHMASANIWTHENVPLSKLSD